MKLNFFRLFALCGLVGCCLCIVGCQRTTMPTGDWVQVTRVVSGQTIEVLDSTGGDPLQKTVRLLGIDAPDWLQQQPWSRVARQRLETLIKPDNRVLLEFDVETDRVTSNGQSLRLAYLWHHRTLLNEVLVEEGLVLARSRAPNLKYEQRLRYAQEKARLLGLGIWNPKHPMRQDPRELEKL